MQNLNNLTFFFAFLSLRKQINLYLISIQGVVCVVHIYVYVFAAILASNVSLTCLFHIDDSYNIVFGNDVAC